MEGKMRHLIILCSLFFVLFSVQQASAGCRTTPLRFSFDSNAETSAEASVTGDGSCRLNFRAIQGMYEDSSILKKPRNGTLRQINITSFFYKANAGFKGKDDFTLKLCGTRKTGSSGCVTANYVLNIE